MLTFKPLKTYLLSGSACAALAMGAAAQAQTAPVVVGPTPSTANPQDSDPSSRDADEVIVVTGTRVIRDGFSAPTPLTVMTQQEIQNSSPTNNIADFVNQLPSLAGSVRPSNSRLELSNGQAGLNILNLRNLGTRRTLVLIDGRRSVGSTSSGVVDVNTIPQQLVDRVEVATSGASAAYGSDAVSGVVNFILNKKYTGLKVTGDIGITDKGDGFNYSADVAGGMAFADGRGHVIIAAEISHTDGIFTVDRDWNHTGFVRIQDPAWTASSTTPRFLIRRQVGAANSTPGGLITSSAGGTANRLRGTYFGAGGSVNQYQFGALTFPVLTGSLGPTHTQGGDWRINDSGRRIGLNPRDDRHGVFGRVSFDVADSITLFAEGSYNRNETLFNAGPNLITGLTLQATNCQAVPTPTTCNAFLYNAFRNSPGGTATLTGLTNVTLGTTAVDLPNRNTNNVRKVQRYVVGAQGEFNAFGKSARWDIYGQYGRAELHEQLRNIQHTTRRNNARDAVFALAGNPGGFPVGSIQCLVNVNTSTADDDLTCRPLNLLGIGVADPAAIDYVLGDPFRDQTLEQTVAGANLSLTPFATWAGDVSVAVGAEYRKEQIKGFVPQEFQPLISGGTTTTFWSVGNYLPTKGSYNVKEAYFETVVPLGLGLEFNGAIRATDYSTSGYVTTWKAGATWQPIDDIRLRVTRSRDIRAPNLDELFQAGQQNTSSISPNPFTTGPFAALGAALPYLGTITGNRNLRPEVADQWNVGAVISPRFIPGFTASADYFDIDLKDAIATLDPSDIARLCAEGNSQVCDAIVLDPLNTTRVLISRAPFNYVSVVVRGVDFEAAYRTRIAQGNVTLRGVATRYIENTETTGLPNSLAINIVGDDSLPKWFFRFSANYDTPSFGITAVARGVSSSVFDAAAVECLTNCPVSTGQRPTYDDLDISGAFYVDLNLTKKFNVWGNERGGEFFVNVTNLFDRWPILLPETGLAANTTYSDLLGRAFRVGMRLKLR